MKSRKGEIIVKECRARVCQGQEWGEETACKSAREHTGWEKCLTWMSGVYTTMHNY
jgi:hypothetical protein